jgi:hypothetical protein
MNITVDKLEDLSADIFVGLRSRDTGRVFSDVDVYAICQSYCDSKGLCVSVTKTTYIYTQGNEPGVIVGLINYPRFPTTASKMFDMVMELSNELMTQLDQYRVSFNYGGHTYMLTNPSKNVH